MSNEDGGVRVVYNGEIYNHRELRAELQRRGHAFRGTSDTEVLVHLYEEEGERFVERLRGIFAFALYDRRRCTLLLARDRFGVKPLFLATVDEQWVFASEIKAIAALAGFRPELDRQACFDYLGLGSGLRERAGAPARDDAPHLARGSAGGHVPPGRHASRPGAPAAPGGGRGGGPVAPGGTGPSRRRRSGGRAPLPRHRFLARGGGAPALEPATDRHIQRPFSGRRRRRASRCTRSGRPLRHAASRHRPGRPHALPGRGPRPAAAL